MSRAGEKLRDLRNAKGLSLKQLAKKLGVAEKFVNDIELGRKVISEDLIDKVKKVLGEDLNDLTMYEGTEEEVVEEKKYLKAQPKKPKEEINPIWGGALSSIVKAVPVFNYNLNKQTAIPRVVEAGKIDGLNSEKLFYVIVEDDDLLENRIKKGDLALLFKGGELENNKISFVEYNGVRMLRLVKNLDNGKVLLMSKGGSMSQTATKNDLKLLGKLVSVEIKFN